MIETVRARQTLYEIELRDRDLFELENSIQELHDMFLDLTYVIYSKV
jgi:t-SNARE complex subunit (syntaxin)